MKNDKQNPPPYSQPSSDVLFIAGPVYFGRSVGSVLGTSVAASCFCKHISGQHGHVTEYIEATNRRAYQAETRPEYTTEDDPSAEELFYGSKIVSVYPAEHDDADLVVVTTYLDNSSWNRFTLVILLSEQKDADPKVASRLTRYVIDLSRFVSGELESL